MELLFAMKEKWTLFIKGTGASPGVAVGSARIAFDLSEAIEKMRDADILVVPSTDPSWVICMLKAKAIITDNGGILSHAAIVSRELGIPCVVGTGDATNKLKNGDKILVNGSDGTVCLEGGVPQ